MTAATSAEPSSGRSPRNGPSSGRRPWRHSCQNCWSANRSRRDLPSSVIFGFVQSQLAGHPGDGACELLAAGVGGAAHLAGDVGPLAALGAQVGQAPLLVAEPVAERREQLPPLDDLT